MSASGVWWQRPGLGRAGANARAVENGGLPQGDGDRNQKQQRGSHEVGDVEDGQQRARFERRLPKQAPQHHQSGSKQRPRFESAVIEADGGEWIQHGWLFTQC